MGSLGTFPAVAVLRVEDLERARRFYVDVLGLSERTSESPSGELAFEAGMGTMVVVYERPGMPAPQNTTLSFMVPDSEFDVVIDELRAKGVVFEEYDIPEIGLKTVNGVAQMDGALSAWFVDPDGNILVINSM